MLISVPRTHLSSPAPLPHPWTVLQCFVNTAIVPCSQLSSDPSSTEREAFLRPIVVFSLCVNLIRTRDAQIFGHTSVQCLEEPFELVDTGKQRALPDMVTLMQSTGGLNRTEVLALLLELGHLCFPVFELELDQDLSWSQVCRFFRLELHSQFSWFPNMSTAAFGTS